MSIRISRPRTVLIQENISLAEILFCANWSPTSRIVDIWRLNRGGHDALKVFAAYKQATEHKGRPTVILAKTVKGYGMGGAGEGQNITHQKKKLSADDISRVSRSLPNSGSRRRSRRSALLQAGGRLRGDVLSEKCAQRARRQLPCAQYEMRCTASAAAGNVLKLSLKAPVTGKFQRRWPLFES